MGKHDISPRFCWMSIFVFFPNFYAFLNEPGCSVMSAWCPDDNLNCFHWISILFGICITWVKILDGIEYEHHISLNMRIMAGHGLRHFGIPEVNFSVEAFKLGMLRDLTNTCDISSRFSQILIYVFFQNYFNLPSCALMTVVWTITQFLFYWIKKISGICILCVKIFKRIEYPDTSWYKSCFLVDFIGVCSERRHSRQF